MLQVTSPRPRRHCSKRLLKFSAQTTLALCTVSRLSTTFFWSQIELRPDEETLKALSFDLSS